MIATYQSYLLLACICLLAVLGAVLFAMKVYPSIVDACRRMGKLKLASRVLLVVSLLSAVIYGGRKGRITYPYVDIEQRYLQDHGSYVTNDLVHVDFTRMIAPSSAEFFISYRETSSTNDEDWAVLVATTFAEFTVPQDIAFENATNFDFMAYTTWTPGPSVQTNGVWHSYWGKDQKLHTHFIPIRTCVRVDDEVIATPKSKENAQ